MTEDELGAQFERLRAKSLRVARHRFPYMEPETLDMLYTDCWYSLRDATFRLDSLGLYLQTALGNRVKNYLRDRAHSQDLFERFTRIDPDTDDDAENLTQLIYNMPDHRGSEGDYNEQVAERVRSIMDEIPSTLRVVAEWYYVDEQTQQSIAEQLGCDQQNVSRMLMRFRAIFKTKYIEINNIEERIWPTHI